jgi:hypothetical protein
MKTTIGGFAAGVLAALAVSVGAQSANGPKRSQQLQAAVPQFYQCRVGESWSLGDSARLVASNPLNVIGTAFTVDGKTGVMKGSLVDNTTYESRAVVFTPPDNLFYVVSTSHGPNRSVNLLMIRDWVPGPTKPFLATSDTHVLTGSCTRWTRD